MKTFILLTFGFLGFAFYQMSGGADFEPASARSASLDVTEAEESPRPIEVPAPVATTPAPETNVTSITKIDSSENVTRVALDLTPAGDSASVETPSEPARSTARIIDSSETPQIILPSLIATTNTNANDTGSRDVRIVSGNRVNVRGGPSTDFGIVGKLGRGDEVRILEDNGAGWVRMEPLDGGESGWMADFLLNEG